MKFVDANIFIYHLASDPKYGRVAKGILSRIQDGEEFALTSTIVVSQVCSYLKWKKKTSGIQIFLEFLRSLPNLTKGETTFADYLGLTTWKGIQAGNWDDIVIASQMKRLGIDEIYSNDSDFDSIPGIKRVFE
jgi:predicted nucleic acid-binding protein